MRGFGGGRNSGKTYAGGAKALLNCLEPTLGVIAAPHFPVLAHGARRQFLQRHGEAGLAYQKNDQKGTLSNPAICAEVLFATRESESRSGLLALGMVQGNLVPGRSLLAVVERS